MKDANIIEIADFDTTDWRSRSKYVQIPNCWHFSIEFRSATQKYMDTGNERGARAMNFLQQLTEIHFDTDNPNDPFKAAFIAGDHRSLTPSDLSPHEMQLVRWLAIEAEPWILKSRFHDMLWVAAKDYTSGTLAIGEYLEAAKASWQGNDVEFISPVKRATQLAAKLDKSAYLPQCKTAIEELLIKAQTEGRLERALSLLEVMHDQRLCELGELAERIRPVAEGLVANNNEYVAHIALGLLARTLSRAKKSEEKNAVLHQEASLYELQASAKASAGHFMVAADLMTKSIAVLRQIGKNSNEIIRLQKKLLEYQESSIQEMSPTEAKWSISEDDFAPYRELVHGFGLWEALIRMTRALQLSGKEETRKNYEKTHEGLIFPRLLSTVVVNKRGAVLGQIPPANFDGSSEEEEERIMMHLYQDAAINRQIAGLAIDIMRETIYKESHPSVSDFRDLVSNHPFVEPGHEILFARALKAGMDDDKMLCAHLLIPQVENSLRHILRAAGAIVSDIKLDNTQDEASLGKLFSEHKKLLITLLGEPAYFNLRGLLIIKYSTNLRNLSLHGLMNDAEYDSYEITFLWWLVLRILLARYQLPERSIESDGQFVTTPETSNKEKSFERKEQPTTDVTEEIEKPPQVSEPSFGFRKESWGTGVGFWHIFLENCGPELEYLDTSIDVADNFFLSKPHKGLLVHSGGHVDIKGTMKSLTLSEEINPQGQVPFRLFLKFKVDSITYSQELVTYHGLSNDLRVNEPVESQ